MLLVIIIFYFFIIIVVICIFIIIIIITIDSKIIEIVVSILSLFIIIIITILSYLHFSKKPIDIVSSLSFNTSTKISQYEKEKNRPHTSAPSQTSPPPSPLYHHIIITIQRKGSKKKNIRISASRSIISGNGVLFYLENSPLKFSKTLPAVDVLARRLIPDRSLSCQPLGANDQ